MEAVAAVAVPDFAICWRCKAQVAVERKQGLWSGDPVDAYAEHQREEASWVCNAKNEVVREVRQVRCRASGDEVVR